MSILPQPPRHPARQLAKRLLDILMPGSCLLCGGEGKGSLLCADCESDLPALPSPNCPNCAIPTTYGERCGACLKSPPAFEHAVALYAYDFPADRLIHNLKYGHQLAIAGWLGEKLARQLTNTQIDLILPLPLHPARLRERGFNQSAELAKGIGNHLNLPVDRDNLLRLRATPPQAELPLKERHKNVRGAFECRVDLTGRRLLLVDDVMTSGATVNECARILKLHGASEITVAVAARALKH